MEERIMKTPVNQGEMITLMREAIARARADTNPQDVDEEALTLLASGRLNLLTPDKRQTILKQVAASPELGALMRELSELGWAQEQVHDEYSPFRYFLRATQGAWAA